LKGSTKPGNKEKALRKAYTGSEGAKQRLAIKKLNQALRQQMEWLREGRFILCS